MANNKQSLLRRYAGWIIAAVVLCGFFNARYPDVFPSLVSQEYRERIAKPRNLKPGPTVPNSMPRDAIAFENEDWKQRFLKCDAAARTLGKWANVPDLKQDLEYVVELDREIPNHVVLRGEWLKFNPGTLAVAEPCGHWIELAASSQITAHSSQSRLLAEQLKIAGTAESEHWRVSCWYREVFNSPHETIFELSIQARQAEISEIKLRPRVFLHRQGEVQVPGYTFRWTLPCNMQYSLADIRSLYQSAESLLDLSEACFKELKQLAQQELERGQLVDNAAIPKLLFRQPCFNCSDSRIFSAELCFPFDCDSGSTDREGFFSLKPSERQAVYEQIQQQLTDSFEHEQAYIREHGQELHSTLNAAFPLLLAIPEMNMP